MAGSRTWPPKLEIVKRGYEVTVDVTKRGVEVQVRHIDSGISFVSVSVAEETGVGECPAEEVCIKHRLA